MSELDEYEEISNERIKVVLTKQRGKLVVTETQEYLGIECKGSIKVGQIDEVYLYQWIDELAEGEKAYLTLSIHKDK